MTGDEIRNIIAVERWRQELLWTRDHEWGCGDCSSPDVGIATKALVLAEEAGEVVKAVLNGGPDIEAYDPADREALIGELVQVAAVAWAILEGL